jgi:hypothetical protein
MTTENLQNLEAERSEIVRQLHSPPEPEPDAQRLVDEADKLIAAHELRIAELKDRRDQINTTFQVRQAEYDAARAREREERHAEAIAGLHAAEGRRLVAVERLEEAVNAVAEAINAQNAAAEDVRRHARDLVRMAGIERISLLGLSQNDLTQRTAARLAPGRVESCLTRPISLEARP